MSRVPIRLRLTAVFVVAMALILAATGLFLYFRLASSLDRAIDDGLRSRADDVSALVRRSDGGLREGGGSTLSERDESFAQVLATDGEVVDATPQVGEVPLLDAVERRRAASGPLFLDRPHSPGGDDDPARLLAVPVEGRLVVVGTSVEEREEALAGLLAQLALGGPLALLLAAAVAYWLAGAALRPVERMREEAEAIGLGPVERRLPVPPANDEIGRLGRTLNEMLDRLAAALQRERDFLADASHELRTPLALLRGELELALRRPRSPEELEAAVRSAAHEADRLARLAEDLLLLARADRGRLPVRLEAVPAAEAVGKVAARFAERAGAAGRAIVGDADGVGEVLADPVRLDQALGNLVDNALRHGGGTVTVRAAERDGTVELHVLDEGSGFGEELLARAFQRFARADAARSSQGSGLGLAIAREIARAHGGDAGAADRPDGGADVWISIPRRRA